MDICKSYVALHDDVFVLQSFKVDKVFGVTLKEPLTFSEKKLAKCVFGSAQLLFNSLSIAPCSLF